MGMKERGKRKEKNVGEEEENPALLFQQISQWIEDVICGELTQTREIQRKIRKIFFLDHSVS